MVGFFDGFTEGFLKTSANTVLKRKADEEEIDNAKKKAIALIDPEAEVYRRKQEIETQNKDAERTKSFARMQQLMGGTTPDATVNPDGSTPVTPTSVDPTTIGTRPSAEDVNSIFDQMQKFTKVKAAAEVSGDREIAQFADTQIDAMKQKMEFIKTNASIGAKPAVGAEGTNIVESIQKDNDNLIKNKTSVSPYFPTSMNMMTNDPRIATEHKRLNEEHQALAQAVAGAKKGTLAANTPEVSSTIARDTANVIKNVNTLQLTDKRVTPEMKKQAANDIENYFDSLSPIEQQKVRSDPNFTAVFTPEIQQMIADNLEPTASVQVTPIPETKPTVAAPKTDNSKGVVGKTRASVKPETKPAVAPTNVLSTPQAADIKARFKAGKITRAQAKKELEALSTK